jgi:parallel beta helix pectate lyase-like protein
MNLRPHGRIMLGAAVAALAIGTAAGIGTVSASAAATTYYLDCSAGTDGTGTSTAPWNSLTDPTGHQFSPGDTLLIKRGTRCSGVLGPKGSGTADAPITISDYGSAADPPVIDGGSDRVNTAAVIIRDESYWRISDLSITGGYWRNLWITSSVADTTLHGFTLSDLDLEYNGFHAGTGEGNWVSGTGGLVVEPCAATAKLADVTVTNVHAHNTHSVGIQIGHSEGLPYDPTETAHSVNTPDCHMGLVSGTYPAKDGVQNVTISQSESNDNEESGIWLAGTTDATVDHNALHGNGGVAGLNGEGAWWSNSANVTVQYNQSYGNKRGQGDGGGFDADSRTTNSLIQYNDGYDNDSYCVAAFGGADGVTSEVTIRYNTCTDNGQSSDTTAQDEGDLFTWTAAGSSIANYRAYSNTIARTAPGPAFHTDSVYDPSQPDYISDNSVRHPGGGLLIDVILPSTDAPGPAIDHNRYTFTGGTTYSTYFYGMLYTTLAGYQQDAGQDQNSTFDLAS